MKDPKSACFVLSPETELVAHISSICEANEELEQIFCENEELCLQCGDIFITVASHQTHMEKYHDEYETCVSEFDEDNEQRVGEPGAN